MSISTGWNLVGRIKNVQYSYGNKVINEMNINFNVFGVGIKYKIAGESLSSLTITLKH